MANFYQIREVNIVPLDSKRTAVRLDCQIEMEVWPLSETTNEDCNEYACASALANTMEPPVLALPLSGLFVYHAPAVTGITIL